MVFIISPMTSDIHPITTDTDRTIAKTNPFQNIWGYWSSSDILTSDKSLAMFTNSIIPSLVASRVIKVIDPTTTEPNMRIVAEFGLSSIRIRPKIKNPMTITTIP